jgi:hypothetical protein
MLCISLAVLVWAKEMLSDLHSYSLYVRMGSLAEQLLASCPVVKYKSSNETCCVVLSFWFYLVRQWFHLE